MGFVRNTPEYRALSVSRSPEVAAALAATGTMQHVEKVWAEFAYEAARIDIAPSMPSRLDSLYALADPIEAFSFTEHSESAHAIWEIEVDEGVPWAMVDMSKFASGDAGNRDPAGYAALWDDRYEVAKGYWQPPGEIVIGEILIGGPARTDATPPPSAAAQGAGPRRLERPSLEATLLVRDDRLPLRRKRVGDCADEGFVADPLESGAFRVV